MINRYSRQIMRDVWSDQSKYAIWFEIEMLAHEAMESIGLIESGLTKKIRDKLNNITFDVGRISEIESKTHHDVIAFLTFISEKIGEREARYLHQGMTSSDILDTCLCIQLKKSSYLIREDLTALLKELSKKAEEYKYLPTIGRSHGIHAEPTTVGLKFAQAYAEFDRALKRMEIAEKEISICSLSGSFGTFANIDPRIEKYVANKLSLNIETISTQIIPRDRFAYFFASLGVLAGSIERISTEIRHLQRTEVDEMSEQFQEGQKGSSSMPHKRNPVLTENLTGIARLIRGAVTPALENISLWHERDISHSSVERVIGPDTTILMDFALSRLTNVIKNIVVNKKNIKVNLDKLNGLIYSQRILLLLTQKGVSREDGYDMVQKNAAKSWDKQSDFKKIILSDKGIMEILTKEEVDSLFSLEYHLKNVDYIFDNVFGE
ncbi:MAG: adenylosuccinate lyase [Rhizobiales bacterium TMED28]|nr:adenylosuccinate lyase [Rhodobiaceae bacterium]OUT83363.1 MAG: adenylosuccinate lyase [Rhizobiales bacterium TMED28]